MTREEAMQRFNQAVWSALDGAEVMAAVDNLHEVGIDVERLEVNIFAKVESAPVTKQHDDAAFLRKLRIDPNIEVRE